MWKYRQKENKLVTTEYYEIKTNKNKHQTNASNPQATSIAMLVSLTVAALSSVSDHNNTSMLKTFKPKD